MNGVDHRHYTHNRGGVFQGLATKDPHHDILLHCDVCEGESPSVGEDVADSKETILEEIAQPDLPCRLPILVNEAKCWVFQCITGWGISLWKKTDLCGTEPDFEAVTTVSSTWL